MTDSAILTIKQADQFLSDLEKLKHIIDLTIFPKNSPLYDPSQTETEGKWKLEGFKVRQFLSLRQKSYSVLEENDCEHQQGVTCDSCVISKGIRKRKVCHFKYLDGLNKKHNGTFNYLSIVRDNTGNWSVKDCKRTFLSQGDGNGVWTSQYESKPKAYRSVGS